MNRIEFMAELEALLQDISLEERMEAMQYYNDYFDDAGVEQEENIIKELESPAKVAAEVKEGLKIGEDETGEYRETGYTDTRFEYKEPPARHGQKAENTGEYSYAGEANMDSKPRTNKTLKIILIILIAITVLPIAGPIAIGLVAAVIGLLIAFAAVIAAVILVMVVLVVVGIALTVAGVVTLITDLASGLALMGIGLVTGVIGAVATVIAIRGCIVFIPAIFRAVVKVCKKIVEKRGKAVV